MSVLFSKKRSYTHRNTLTDFHQNLGKDFQTGNVLLLAYNLNNLNGKECCNTLPMIMDPIVVDPQTQENEFVLQEKIQGGSSASFWLFHH